MGREREVRVKITATDNFSQATNKYNQAMTQMASTSQRTMTSMDGLGNLAKGLFAGASVAGVVALTGEIYALGQASLKAEATFTQLSGGADVALETMDKLKTATGNIVSEFELMQGANQLMAMGLAKNSDEVARLTELAVKLGGAMGSDAATSISDFSAMLANNSIERLDTFGISSGQVRMRIDELLASGEALDRSEAFTMATLEIGAQSLERLGDAALVGETAIARLQTKWNDFTTNFAEDVAGVLNDAATSFEQLTFIMGQQAVQNAASADNQVAIDAIAYQMRSDRGSSYLFAEADPAMQEYRQQAAELVRQFGFEFYTTMMQEGMSVADTIDRMIADGAARITESARSGQYAAALDSLRSLGEQAARDRAAIERDMLIGNQPGALSGYTNELTSMMMLGSRGILDGAMLFSQDEAQNADMLASRVDQIMNNLTSLHEQGIIGDEDLARFGELADRAGDIRDRIREGADALKDMTLDQALFGGTDPNELLGGLAGGLDTSSWTQAQLDQLGMATGQETALSLAIRDAQARISGLPADQAIGALGNFETLLREGRAAGYDDSQLANVAGAYGRSNLSDDAFARITDFAGLDFSQASADATAIEDSLVNATGEVDALALALDEAFRDRAINLQINAAAPQWLTALLGLGSLNPVDIVRAGTAGNNGNVPGANTDSNSRSTPPPTAPVPQIG